MCKAKKEIPSAPLEKGEYNIITTYFFVLLLRDRFAKIFRNLEITTGSAEKLQLDKPSPLVNNTSFKFLQILLYIIGIRTSGRVRVYTHNQFVTGPRLFLKIEHAWERQFKETRCCKLTPKFLLKR